MVQARVLLLPVPKAGKMSGSKLICYFSSNPVAFGFWTCSPPDSIILNPANKSTDQCLLHCETIIGANAHATLDTEQLISHTRSALVDIIASLQCSEGGVIAA